MHSRHQSAEHHHPYQRTAPAVFYLPPPQQSQPPPLQLQPPPALESYFQYQPQMPLMHGPGNSGLHLLDEQFQFSKQDADGLNYCRRPLAAHYPEYSPTYSNHHHNSHVSEKCLPSLEDFEQLLNEYIFSLSPKKRDKALIPQRRYDNILAVLREPKCTTIESAQFRFWAKKMFRLGVVDNAQVVTHEGKPVAVKEALYGILIDAHLQAQHGGRDKTSSHVRKFWSWVPKELIARFVRGCPSCRQRRPPPSSRRSSIQSTGQSPGGCVRSVTNRTSASAPYSNAVYPTPQLGIHAQAIQIVAQGGNGGILFPTQTSHPNSPPQQHLSLSSWPQN